MARDQHCKSVIVKLHGLSEMMALHPRQKHNGASDVAMLVQRRVDVLPHSSEERWV